MTVIKQWMSSFLTLLGTFSWHDVIDILIITVLIYSILKLIHDTRAEQLLKGIVFILVFYALAVILRLTMVRSILKVFLEFSVILIFVIFQPELRKALEQLGSSKIKNGYFKKLFQGGLVTDEYRETMEKAISDVADAATLFSHTKTGALIVFERDIRLTDIANTGTILNCDTSAAIFGNLFFNKAPLHDGACIVRSGKIFAAGCILPLNSKDIGNKEVGTRHRAAVGMSEVSDAIVVVISEETGQISTAINGNLVRDYDRDSLIRVLEDMLIPDEPELDKKNSITSIFKKRKVQDDEE